MSSSSSETLEQSNVQNVIVMRHGDRLDNADPLWISSAERPWDPPLTEGGKIRAWNTGKKLRKNPGFKIDRVFVSPFLRCIQTANEVITALCADGDSDLLETSENAIIDPSGVKVTMILPYDDDDDGRKKVIRYRKLESWSDISTLFLILLELDLSS